MKQNPCRYCELSTKYTNNRSGPSHKKECSECERYEKHKQYLQSKRKFEEGETITKIDELLKQEWVMLYHATKHIEVLKHMNIATVLKWLESGAIHKAIRKEHALH